MLRITLILSLLATPVFAQDVDAGVSNNAGVGVVDAPMKPLMVAQPDGGMAEAVPMELAKTVFTAVKAGNWWLAASAFLVLVVGLLRALGKKFHDWLPDDNVLDKPLYFIFDTKIGAWLLNWFTAIAGGLGMSIAAGVQPDFSIWKSVLMVSTTGTMLVELYKDIVEWWKTRQAKAAEEAAAKAAVVAVPAPVEPPKPGV